MEMEWIPIKKTKAVLYYYYDQHLTSSRTTSESEQHLTTTFDKNIWRHHSTTTFDNNIWQQHLITSDNIWQHLMALAFQKRTFFCQALQEILQTWAFLLGYAPPLHSHHWKFPVSYHTLFHFKMALLQSSLLFCRLSILLSV